MINIPLDQLVDIPVPAAALAAAILLGSPRSDPFDRGRLLLVAQRHGGGRMLAEAIALRLSLLGRVLEQDPSALPPRSLTASEIGEALAQTRLRIENGELHFDGEGLANRLRLVSASQGQA